MVNYLSTEIFRGDELIRVSKNTALNPDVTSVQDFIEIIYVLSGSGTHYINGKRYPVKSGTLLYVDYPQTHSFIEDESMVCYNIYIKPEMFTDDFIRDNSLDLVLFTLYKQFYSEDTSLSCIFLKNEEKEKFERIILEMYNEYTIKSEVSGLIVDSYFKILFAYIFRHIAEPTKDMKSDFDSVIQYILAHYDEKITVESLAKQTFYSPKYLGRLFKEQFGTSLKAYVMEIRMKEAERLLRTTDMSANDISYAVGYHNNVSFYKYFRSYYGLTPLQYRKKIKQENVELPDAT